LVIATNIFRAFPGIADTKPPLKEWWSPTELAGNRRYTWETYRDHQLSQVDKLRTHLHRSRLLGIAATLFAAVLALVVLGIGAFADPLSSAYVGGRCPGCPSDLRLDQCRR
jgi:hypothetical protein